MKSINEKLLLLKESQLVNAPIAHPIFFRIGDNDQRKSFEKLLSVPGIIVSDFLITQIEELIKIKTPSVKYNDKELRAQALKHIEPLTLEEYGVWVYYPWSNRLVHIPDEEEFIEIRTSRNQYKITKEERDELRTKCIGVVGLSVGQSVALTLAMERICGELRLADFDTLELTNLNRIRTGVHNLGIPKVIAVAREIFEIDPFFKVKCFLEGLQEENMDTFFLDGGKLDLLIEESDGFEIKILSRHKAKKLKIPVLMETSDRCMVDVERFDLEPDRSILHGLVDHLDLQTLKSLKTNEDKVPYMLDILGLDNMSLRLKASMMEIEQSIKTWPQLASAVAMGGGIAADLSRRILLGTFSDSGRYNIDIEELICDRARVASRRIENLSIDTSEIKEISVEDMEFAVGKIYHREGNKSISDDLIKSLTRDAIQAPSGGNNQPWKWFSSKGELFLFHDKIRSAGWSDPYDNVAKLALGATIENLRLSANQKGYSANVQYYPVENEPLLIAQIVFTVSESSMSLNRLNQYNTIYLRCTNRKKGENVPIEKSILDAISESGGEGAKVLFTENIKEIAELSDIVATVEKLRFMHPMGYKEFFEKEIRWTGKDAVDTKDGLDIATLELSNTEKAAMKVAANSDVIGKIREWNGGNGFKKISSDAIKKSSAMGLLSLENKLDNIYLRGGEALQRVWLTTNFHNISFHPVSAPLFFFDWMKQKNELPKEMILELKELEKRFFKVFADDKLYLNIFLFRLAICSPPTERSLRRSVDECLFIK